MLGQPNMNVTVDRDAAARYQINMADVQDAIQTAVGGKALTQVLQGEARYDLVLRYLPQYRTRKEAIENIRLLSPSGERVSLAQLCKVGEPMGLGGLSRQRAGTRWRVEGHQRRYPGNRRRPRRRDPAGDRDRPSAGDRIPEQVRHRRRPDGQGRAIARRNRSAPLPGGAGSGQRPVGPRRGTLANAKIDLGRYKALWKQNAISQQILQTQVATVGNDQGTVVADKAAVEAAAINLEFCRITSPVAGRVGLRQVDPGNSSSPAGPRQSSS